MVKPSKWDVFLANFAMGRNKEVEDLTDSDMIGAYVRWDFISRLNL